jgi:hypothetical protein
VLDHAQRSPALTALIANLDPELHRLPLGIQRASSGDS